MSSAIQSANRVASTAAIRSYFPALERAHNNQPVAYFDGPGGTQVPRQVVEAMADYLYHHNANTHWAYPTSEETDAAIENARQVCAEFLNASPDEIAFGANMTTLTFHLSRALGVNYGAGDEIIVTELDHHANVAPWQRLAVERGLTVRTVKMIPETGRLDWDDFERSISGRTKLIAVGAASNALGTINDVARAVRAAREVGAQILVDAVHYVPHALADVRALDCDFLTMSAYKFYGPHIGVLFCKRELLDAIDFPKLIPAPDVGPERVETGTQNQEGMVGTAAAIDFLASLAVDRFFDGIDATGIARRRDLSTSATADAFADPAFAIAALSRRSRLRTVYDQLHARSFELVQRLWQGLSSIKHVRVYGPSPTEPRTPTVSFTIEGVASTEVARRLAATGLFLSHGDFYAATVIERLGLVPEGLVRAGCACYTTADEIERLIEAVEQIAFDPKPRTV
jgi:cysteine desulfurase family protein (TIGR01976 family)